MFRFILVISLLFSSIGNAEILKVKSTSLVFLNTAIIEESYEKLKLDINKVIAAENKTVNILVNSSGGRVDIGTKMILYIKSLRKYGATVNCIVQGSAKSMAFYLLRACSNRYITKDSTVQLHVPMIMVVSYINYLIAKQLVERTKPIYNRFLTELYQIFNLDKHVIKQLYDNDTEFSADEIIAITKPDWIKKINKLILID